MLMPQWQMKQPMRGAAPRTSMSGGYCFSVTSSPRESLRRLAASAAAALHWVTVSGMSFGPWNAPATKTPGRDVLRGANSLVAAKPCSFRSTPSRFAVSCALAGADRPDESTTRSNFSRESLPASSSYAISRSWFSTSWTDATRERMKRTPYCDFARSTYLSKSLP